ncbi:hypothetical protein AB0M46_37915 [Dactylosporangium sp. NPDC051485]|uniref:hypothetical protein n=1 Tax=Dactylosporangium sp. NPDC051485 TaxID=3154846 RepID=UPI00342C5265
MAMSYFRAFPSEVSNYVPQIFTFTLGGRWEGAAVELLAVGSRELVLPQVVQCVAEHIPMRDPEDYVQLAGLLARLDAGDTIEFIASDALRSDDHEVRAAGDSIRETYKHLLHRQ